MNKLFYIYEFIHLYCKQDNGLSCDCCSVVSATVQRSHSSINCKLILSF
uniref:Uncharacterized protein n=1 Tax=Arundo donax TaxID=35708 RepID=A0A0A9F4H5_ARUDO